MLRELINGTCVAAAYRAGNYRNLDSAIEVIALELMRLRYLIHVYYLLLTCLLDKNGLSRRRVSALNFQMPHLRRWHGDQGLLGREVILRDLSLY